MTVANPARCREKRPKYQRAVNRSHWSCMVRVLQFHLQFQDPSWRSKMQRPNLKTGQSGSRGSRHVFSQDAQPTHDGRIPNDPGWYLWCVTSKAWHFFYRLSAPVSVFTWDLFRITKKQLAHGCMLPARLGFRFNMAMSKAFAPISPPKTSSFAETALISKCRWKDGVTCQHYLWPWLTKMVLPGLKGVYFWCYCDVLPIFRDPQAFLKSSFSGWIWLHWIVLKDTSKMDDGPNSKCACLHFAYCGIALPSFVTTLKNKCVARWRCNCLLPTKCLLVQTSLCSLPCLLDPIAMSMIRSWLPFYQPGISIDVKPLVSFGFHNWIIREKRKVFSIIKIASMVNLILEPTSMSLHIPR